MGESWIESQVVEGFGFTWFALNYQIPDKDDAVPAAVIHICIIIGNGGLTGAEGEGREYEPVSQTHCYKVAG